MLKLEYRRKNDIYQTVTVIGSVLGIMDLHWQLTKNYSSSPDGAEILDVRVTNLDGVDVTGESLFNHIDCDTKLDKNLAN